MPILNCEFRPPIPITPDMVIVNGEEMEIYPMTMIACANIIRRTPLEEKGVGTHDITPTDSPNQYTLEVRHDEELEDEIGFLGIIPRTGLIRLVESNVDQPQEIVSMGPKTIELSSRSRY